MKSTSPIATTLSDRSHSKPSHHHTLLNTVACAKMLLIWHEPVDSLVWKNLAEAFDMGSDIKVLRYLFNALANHCSLNNVFRTHRTTCWQSCGSSIVWTKGEHARWVSGNLWARSKNLPDLEGPLKLYHLYCLHWIRILAIVLGTFRLKHAGYFTCSPSRQRLLSLLFFMQRYNVSTAPTNRALWMLSIGLDDLACLSLWCAVWSRIDTTLIVAREALSNERVYIDAEVSPAISSHLRVWNPSMHLICHDAFRTITKHQTSPSL